MEREAFTSELLDYLFEISVSEQTSLQDVLNRTSSSQIERTSSGLVLTGVSANSSSSTFSFLKTITPGQVIEILYALKRLYKLAIKTLSCNLQEGEVLSDLIIYNWMSDNLEKIFVESVMFDYRGRVL